MARARSLSRRPQNLLKIGQALAAIGDEEFEQLSALLRIDLAALDAALAMLTHQPGGDERRDVMGERRLGDAERALDLADRQTRIACLNQKMEHL